MEKVSKQRREEILERIKKAGSEEYKTDWDEKGRPVSKSKTKVKQGKQSKSSGARFELKVRENLESMGWIVDKWSNNFDLDSSKVVMAKRKFNPFNKVMTIGTGFPDFIAFQLLSDGMYKIIGVESKSNGQLSREEKEKCRGLLDAGVFSKILIARKKQVGRKVEVEYVEFS